MKNTTELLTGNFVICDLGSASSQGWRALGNMRRAVTLIEIDATSESSASDRNYHRRVAVRSGIAGHNTGRPFLKRKIPGGSSFLVPDPQLIQAYELEQYYELDAQLDIPCTTLPEMLESNGIKAIDFLKTDLEGLDYEVLTSAEQIVQKALVVQSELRFQPFYKDEPTFYTVADYLTQQGLELITLSPQVWKYRTTHRSVQRDGRLVWADAVFFLRPDLVLERFGSAAGPAFLKQIVLAIMLGLTNYAEYVYEQHPHLIPDTCRKEVEGALLGPAFPQALLRRTANGISRLPGGNFALIMAQRILLGLNRSITTHSKVPCLGSL